MQESFIFFTETINANNYWKLILHQFIGELSDGEIKNARFQLDDASTARTARESMNYWKTFLGIDPFLQACGHFDSRI